MWQLRCFAMERQVVDLREDQRMMVRVVNLAKGSRISSLLLHPGESNFPFALPWTQGAAASKSVVKGGLEKLEDGGHGQASGSWQSCLV